MRVSIGIASGTTQRALARDLDGERGPLTLENLAPSKNNCRSPHNGPLSAYEESPHGGKIPPENGNGWIQRQSVFGKVFRPCAGAFIEKAPPIVSLRLDIQLASTFESRGGWICRVSHSGNPITRTIRLVGRREGDPAYLEERRNAGRVAG